VLNSNISPTRPYNMANFGPLAAEIVWWVWGTPANCNGFFFTAATSFTGGHPNFARYLDVSWAGTQCIHFPGAFVPWRNFAWCKLGFASKSCVLVYWQHYCTALQQRASAELCGVVQGMGLRNIRRGRHLYSAGRPSHWALAHILVFLVFSSSNLSGRRLDVYHTSTLMGVRQTLRR